MRYLFIGGDQDGTWKEREHANDFIKLEKRPDIEVSMFTLMSDVVNAKVEHELYKLHTWNGQSEAVFRFYALATLEVNEAFRMLMNGYRRSV